MREKEILGFKYEEKNTDSVCQNCGYGLTIPLKVEKQTGFLGIKIEYWDEYTCSECGLQWRVKKY